MSGRAWGVLGLVVMALIALVGAAANGVGQLFWWAIVLAVPGWLWWRMCTTSGERLSGRLLGVGGIVALALASVFVATPLGLMGYTGAGLLLIVLGRLWWGWATRAS